MASKPERYLFLGGSENGFYGTLVKKESESPPPPPQWSVPEMTEPPVSGPSCPEEDL